MIGRFGQRGQESPATHTDRAAENLLRLREARHTLANQDLIAGRVEERQRMQLMQIERAKQKVAKLEGSFKDIVTHRRIVIAVLHEELRRAELLAESELQPLVDQLAFDMIAHLMIYGRG